MKKTYECPKIKNVTLNTADVITLSKGSAKNVNLDEDKYNYYEISESFWEQ